MMHPEAEAMQYWHENHVLCDGEGRNGTQEMGGVQPEDGGIQEPRSSEAIS